MNAILNRLITAASIMLLITSCESHPKKKTGIAALGIYSTEVRHDDIKSISIVREIDGTKTVWASMETEGSDLDIHIQLGLPGKTMRVAIGGNSKALASSFETDIIKDHPFAFESHSIRKPGEYILMQTQDNNLSNQNKILLIAEK